MEISTQITVKVPDDRVPRISEIEKLVFRAAMTGARLLFVCVLEHLEQRIFAENPDLTKQKRRERWLVTRVGRLKIVRYQARFAAMSRYGYPLDEKLALPKSGEATPWVRKMGARLAACYPYRQAAGLLSAIIGARCCHRAIWRITQAEGRKIRAKQAAARKATFGDGLAPAGSDGPVPSLVVCEADGTMLRDRTGAKMEARLAVAYEGMTPASETAKARRYRLKRKAMVSSLDDVDTFGQDVAIELEEQFSFSSVPTSLFVADGDLKLKKLARSWLPGTVYQLDHFHLAMRATDLARGDPELAASLKKLAFSKKTDELSAVVADAARQGRVQAESAAEFVAYCKANRDGIWASAKLKDRIPDPAMRIIGSGVIEHNVDLVVARRMKKKGMFWSREGAANLLAVRTQDWPYDYGWWYRETV